jgi:hypothetical protein
METNEKSGILFKLFLYLKNKFDPKPVVSEEINTSTQITLKLLDYEDTEVIYAPLSNKRFVINESKSMSITIENRVVHIINHVYSYSIYIDDNDCYRNIITKFDLISEKKKEILEEKISNNIKHSLNKILEGLS